MSVKYHYEYVNLDRSEELETLVEKKLSSLERRVESRGDREVEVQVRFVVDARSAEGVVLDSHVVMDVKVPGIRHLLVVKKEDQDLRTAAHKAAETLIKEIRRATEKHEHLRQN